MMGVTLQQVTDALEAILEDRVSEVKWEVSLMGPRFPKETTGYIICDEVSYEDFTKGNPIARATFGIQIICPNPKKEIDIQTVEKVAMKVRQALAEEYTLDDWAMDSKVNSVLFGTAPGQKSIGMAILDYTVDYEE